MCTHVYIYIYIYTLFSVTIFNFMWDKIKLGKIILGEMKKILKLIQKHGLMPQTYVKVGWAHMHGEVSKIKKKEERKQNRWHPCSTVFTFILSKT